MLPDFVGHSINVESFGRTEHIIFCELLVKKSSHSKDKKVFEIKHPYQLCWC